MTEIQLGKLKSNKSEHWKRIQNVDRQWMGEVSQILMSWEAQGDAKLIVRVSRALVG